MGKTKKNVAKQTKDVDHIEKVLQWLQSPTLFTKQGESERVKKLKDRQSDTQQMQRREGRSPDPEI